MPPVTIFMLGYFTGGELYAQNEEKSNILLFEYRALEFFVISTQKEWISFTACNIIKHLYTIPSK